MPRAILAMRTYPATILLAVLLFIATLLITTGTLGKVLSGGGDGGDGGSGMGGTGKSGEFGGSGFGGPSPFFTSIDATKPEERADTQQPTAAGETPVVMLVQEQAPERQEDTASALQEEIIEAIEANPLRIETNTEIAQGSRNVQARPITAPAPAPVQLVALPEIEPPEIEAKSAPVQQQLAVSPSETKPEVKPELMEEPQQLAETMTMKLETESVEEESSRERSGLPERIQRPEIPPFQRIRPIERPALLPPRVQPMRI